MTESLISAEIEITASGFDRPLFYRLGYAARRKQVVDDDGGNCSNVTDVKGTNDGLKLIL